MERLNTRSEFKPQILDRILQNNNKHRSNNEERDVRFAVKKVGYDAFTQVRTCSEFETDYLGNLGRIDDILLRKEVSRHHKLKNIKTDGLWGKFEKKIRSFAKKDTFPKKQSVLNMHEIVDICKEDNISQPSVLALDTAERILKSFNEENLNYQLYAYPDEGSRLVLESEPKHRKRLLIHCDSDGKIACFFTFDGSNSLIRCDNIEQFFSDHSSFFKNSIKRLA